MDLKANEEHVLKYWEEHGINDRVRKSHEAGKKFYFLDGPPYTTGQLGAYHIWVETIKDLVLRYKRYRGLNVHDRAGFDVHGLPTEVKIEKQLNVVSKRDIEERIGIEAFVKACRQYAEEQMEGAIATYKRFGSTLDFKHKYLPYESYYISKGWQLFKAMHEKKLVYGGLQPLAYCPRCETVLSAQGPEVEYQDDTDDSLFVRYKVDNKKESHVQLGDNTYLVIWTTTPWTLPANVAIAVNPKELYVSARFGSVDYIIAKSRLDAFASAINESAIVDREFYGSELEGTYYISPLEGKVPEQKRLARYHRVILSESFVSVSEGTGLLHVSTGTGPEDYKLGKQNKLPVFSPVDEHARYTKEAGGFANLRIPDEANKAVIDELTSTGSILNISKITHSYPHCWRSHDKLIFRATEQWFVNVQRLKKRMLKANERIGWHPAVAQSWFAEAVQSSPDWCVSRQRYWGTPLPIWLCGSCGEFEVIGSKEELVERGRLREVPHDLHRPFVDNITFECKKCKGTMKRIPDVFDVWYDAGISHTASLTDEEFKRLYPADWISESHDQIRGWFSALLRTAIAVHGKGSFKRVNIGGWMKDELGQQMHRHLGNITLANDLLDLVSADGYRLWCASHPRWLELRLKKDELVEADSNMITLYNIAELVKGLAQLSKNDIKQSKKPSAAGLDLEDAWILSRLSTLVSRTTENMDNYYIDVAVKEIRDFILEDFSKFYLKFAKQRAELATAGQLKKISRVTAYVLNRALVLAAMITPFACEHIYRELFSTNNESIFEGAWPRPDKRYINTQLESDFEVLKMASNAVLSLREQKGAKLRWPIKSAIVESNDDATIASLERMQNLIARYTNAKSVRVVKGQVSKKVVRPLFEKIGPAFKQRAQEVATELGKSEADAVNASIDKDGYYRVHTSSGPADVLPEHFTIVESVQADKGLTFGLGSVQMHVDIDSEITEELKEEILTREFIRRVQLMRKEMKLTRLDSVSVYAQIEEALVKVLEKNKKQIKSVTKAKELLVNKDMPADAAAKDWDMSGTPVKIAIKR